MTLRRYDLAQQAIRRVGAARPGASAKGRGETLELAFDDSEDSVIEMRFSREHVSDAEFARLLQDIDDLTAWFRGAAGGESRSPA